MSDFLAAMFGSSARTRELADITERFNAALGGSELTVFTQDKDLRYTWIANPPAGLSEADVIGHTDDELLAGVGCDRIAEMKRHALSTGEPQRDSVPVTIAGEPRWLDLRVQPQYDEAGAVVGLLGSAIDVTERKHAERQMRLLMREINHRSKNLLAVVQAVARQTASRSENLDDFLETFGARVEALGRSSDALVAGSSASGGLRGLIAAQLGYHLDPEAPRVELAGPDIRLAPDAAQTLGLAMHELATNAAKYGALSGPDGRIDISWRVEQENGHDVLALTWQERGGPPVSPPSRKGFGTYVVERNVARALDGQVHMDFAEAGLACTMRLPLSRLSDTGEDAIP